MSESIPWVGQDNQDQEQTYDSEDSEPLIDVIGDDTDERLSDWFLAHMRAEIVDHSA